MAYTFHGFIGTLQPIQRLCNQYILARPVSLGQGLFLVPLTEDLQEQLNAAASPWPVEGFELLTEPMESVLAQASLSGAVGYAEVTRWAGEGREAGVIWERGGRVRSIRFGKGVINTLLKSLGCVPAEGKDEFQTMGFAQRRFTDDWLAD